MDNFFRRSGRRMKTASVIQEFFTMVCRKGKQTILPELESPQSLDQLCHLRIHPSDARVVQGNDMVAVSAQPAG